MNQELILQLSFIYNEIFPESEDDLNEFEKRKKIFDYLTNNIKYDFDLYEKIKNRKKDELPLKRDFYDEIMNVLKKDSRKGICNSIAQVYKLILEYAGIYSICTVCDYNSDVAHQINLVKNGDNYSFDDITSAIIDKDSKEKYFNYDLEDAYNIKQGTKNIVKNMNFYGIQSVIIYFHSKLGRFGLAYLQVKDPEYDENKYDKTVMPLPNNIKKYDELNIKR